MEINDGSRPYRSHKNPACDACRQRRSRCIFDVYGEACLFCRLKQTHCQQEGVGAISVASEQTAPNPKRKRVSDRKPVTQLRDTKSPKKGDKKGDSDATPHDTLGTQGQQSERVTGIQDDEAVHVVGPLATSDKQVLEVANPQYGFDSHPGKSDRGATKAASDPIMYRKVNRARPGNNLNWPLGNRELEVLVNVVRRENVREMVSM